MKFLVPLIPLLVSVAAAKEIRWTATGQVTTVAGSGFSTSGASAGNPVAIKFAYGSAATPNVRTNLAGYSETIYQNKLQLSVEITIGTNTWSASLPETTGEVLNVKGDAGFVNLDTFRLAVTDAAGATYPSFPYTGSSTLRNLTIILNDNHVPSRFVDPREYPDEGLRTASISSGTGSVRAGGDAINFVITPSSVKVTTDEPPLPLAIVQTPTTLKLRWPAESGRSYRIQSCEQLPNWANTGFEVATGPEVESVVAATPEEIVRRRFYRVISE